ncbi:hypothetical protein [Flavobacterium litorale]|uniref:Alpha-ketoglutarate decarboxylase n=1 Tax=Flavobacterium litorale TaxID=2856519 RepID=A0ABX8VDN4_9FLAO|nr:hypothetical protein [Flavobacterium litorale]QYJ69268.1 hypothetical protein K1I41_05090 [Flavobacterium litorale]
MKIGFFNFLTKCTLIVSTILCCTTTNAQQDSDFWSRVRFGGTAGVAFGRDYTDILIAPSALYQVNAYVGVGVGLQGSYVNFDDFYESYIYGMSVIGIFSPIPEVQLSAEVEQLRVNLNYDDNVFDDNNTLLRDRDFWNTALFLGAGYNTGNVTIGIRYNVLFRERDRVYSDAFMPFIRVFF